MTLSFKGLSWFSVGAAHSLGALPTAGRWPSEVILLQWDMVMQTSTLCCASVTRSASVAEKPRTLHVVTSVKDALLLSVSVCLFVLVCSLADYTRKYYSDFDETLLDYGVLLWEQPVKFWGWSYSKWQNKSHFGFLHHWANIIYSSSYDDNSSSSNT